MAPIYQFGTQQKNEINADFIFSAKDNGDFTITPTATGTVKVIKSSLFAQKRYNCFDAIVTDILKGYPDTASVYFTDAAAEAISDLAKKNQRTT